MLYATLSQIGIMTEYTADRDLTYIMERYAAPHRGKPLFFFIRRLGRGCVDNYSFV
jgi:hypothetical protein